MRWVRPEVESFLMLLRSPYEVRYNATAIEVIYHRGPINAHHCFFRRISA